MGGRVFREAARRHCRAGLMIVLGMLATSAASGDTPARAQRVNVDGLPHRSVLALLEDRDGFLWIGTADGLARFDGYGMLVYRHDPFNAEGLQSSTVTALLEDRQGLLWVGTENGLHAFDRAREVFSRVTHPGASGEVAVTCALEGSTGWLWFGTTRSGLIAVDPETGALRTYRSGSEARSLRHAHVRALHEDAQDRLQVLSCTPETCCIQVWSEDRGFETAIADLRPTDVWALYSDRSSGLWVDPCGPLEPDVRSGVATRWRDCDSGGGTWAIVGAAQAEIWVGTGRGLFRVDASTRAAHPVALGDTVDDFLANYVRSLYLGRSGILWIGTHSGLFSVDPHARRFRHWGLDRQLHEGEPLISAVSSIVETTAGEIFVGTYGGGLLRLDRAGRVTARHSLSHGATCTPADEVVWDLAVDAKDDLWIAAGDLVKLSSRSGGMTRYSFAEGYSPSFVIVDPSDGRLWLASFRGLARFDPATGEHQPVILAQDRPDLSVESLYRDVDLALWIGTAESLFRLDLASGAVREAPLVTADGISLRGTATWAIHPGADSSLWLGTSVGLLRYSEPSDSVELVSAGAGLPGSSVYSILEGDDGLLWLGTNQGLSCFDPRAEGPTSFRSFSVNDGLGNVEFNRHAAWRGRDGALFFGGLDGVTWFRPGEIRSDPSVPPVHITRIEVNGADGTRAVNPFGLQRLVLSPSDVSFVLELAALSYLNPRGNRYAYRLEGLEPRWIDAGTRRFAQYTGIEPGRYVFHVRGANSDGVWNNEGVSLPVVVEPAFWQTFWFRILLLALAAAVVTAVYRYRVAQARKLQKLRLDLAGDLHDDLSSDLAGIAVVADMLGAQPSLALRQQADLEMIRDTARRLADGVRDIVWYMDPEHDSLDATVDRMRGVAERLLRGISHSIVARVPRRAPDLSMEDRRDLLLIYKEALQNVARHAKAGKVDIVLGADGRRLCLEVCDDGCGFDTRQPVTGHGLRSMRRRAEQMGASLCIDSSPGSGARVTLELARLRDGAAVRRNVG